MNFMFVSNLVEVSSFICLLFAFNPLVESHGKGRQEKDLKKRRVGGSQNHPYLKKTGWWTCLPGTPNKQFLLLGFKWMIPNLGLHEKSVFHHFHPFKTGWLEYQVEFSQIFFCLPFFNDYSHVVFLVCRSELVYELTVVYFPSKIEWDLTNRPLSKLLKLSHVLGSVQWVLLQISWILPKKKTSPRMATFFTESFYSDVGSKA